MDISNIDCSIQSALLFLLHISKCFKDWIENINSTKFKDCHFNIFNNENPLEADIFALILVKVPNLMIEDYFLIVVKSS